LVHISELGELKTRPYIATFIDSCSLSLYSPLWDRASPCLLALHSTHFLNNSSGLFSYFRLSASLPPPPFFGSCHNYALSSLYHISKFLVHLCSQPRCWAKLSLFLSFTPSLRVSFWFFSPPRTGIFRRPPASITFAVLVFLPCSLCFVLAARSVSGLVDVLLLLPRRGAESTNVLSDLYTPPVYSPCYYVL